MVNRGNDRFRRRPGAGHERRSIAAQPQVESLARARHVTGGEHRARDLRPPDRTSTLFVSRGQRSTQIDGHAQVPVERRWLAAIDAGPPLRRQKR
jgi:hypothetical protein